MKPRAFEEALQAYRAQMEQGLDKAIPIPAVGWPSAGIPRTMAEAMRYSLLGGGKRLRAVLLLASHALLNKPDPRVLPFALAVEMIHAYTLIHDDLPAMDDDDLRRGKPSNHKAFGEATAILAGDALLNLAFEVMAQSDHPRAMEALRIIAVRAGARGVIAGQAADLWMENRDADPQMVHYIHRHKTADLIVAPVLAGLALGGADQRQALAGEEYAQHLGMAFQIVDDLLDIQGEAGVLGKETNKDAAAGKLTWPAVYGADRARLMAQQHTDSAVSSLAMFGDAGAFLRELALSMLQRVE